MTYDSVRGQCQSSRSKLEVERDQNVRADPDAPEESPEATVAVEHLARQAGCLRLSRREGTILQV